MSKIATTGRRYLNGDVWHDDNGPIPGTPDAWEPPMTDDEVTEAARSDPNNRPLTDEQLSKMRRVSLARFVRQKLGMSLEAFAAAYDIPIATLRAWEGHETEPTPVEVAYLNAIGRAPHAVRKPAA